VKSIISAYLSFPRVHDKVLERTYSLCPVCFRRIEAQIVAKDDDIYLENSCPEHGDFSTLIWRGVESWKAWDSLNDWEPDISEGNGSLTASEKGCPFDCGLCPNHLRYACVVVLEVTNKCNLNCPICFASSGDADYDFNPDLSVIREMYSTVLKSGCESSKPAIQLSGGEPTIRDDLPEIVAMGKDMGFDCIMVNTNGIRIANEPDFLKALRESGCDIIYLQFDGVNDEVYRAMRGKDLMEIKLRAIENCREEGLSVVLVPTIIRQVNLDQIAPIIEFAKKWIPTVRGIHFQPISFFGRWPSHLREERRLTIPEIIQEIEKQTGGEIPSNSFIPVKSGMGCEAHCSFTHLSFLKKDGSLHPLTKFPSDRDDQESTENKSDPKHARDQIKEFWRSIDEESADHCSCKWAHASFSDPNSFKRNYLSISGMPFQDVMNIETRRLKKCCVQVVTPDGRMIPFCAFNVTNERNESLYRNDVLRAASLERSKRP